MLFQLLLTLWKDAGGYRIKRDDKGKIRIVAEVTDQKGNVIYTDTGRLLEASYEVKVE